MKKHICCVATVASLCGVDFHYVSAGASSRLASKAF